METNQTDPGVQALGEYFVEQKKYQKRQSALSFIRTAAVVGMLLVLIAAAVTVLPRLNAALDTLETTAERLNALEIEPMVQSITQLATEGTAGINTALDDVTRALAKIEELDIDSLNQSISDLGAVVGPLAKLFGR